MASASAQTARTPHAGSSPLLVTNDGPVVQPSSSVADEPAAKPKKGNVATRARSTSQGEAVRLGAAAMQGTAWIAAYAEAPNLIFTSPLALDFPATAPKEQAHLVVPSPVAAAGEVRPETVLTPESQSRVSIMVAEPELPVESRQGAHIWRLLLGAIGGGVLGAA